MVVNGQNQNEQPPTCLIHVGEGTHLWFVDLVVVSNGIFLWDILWGYEFGGMLTTTVYFAAIRIFAAKLCIFFQLLFRCPVHNEPWEHLAAKHLGSLTTAHRLTICTLCLINRNSEGFMRIETSVPDLDQGFSWIFHITFCEYTI